MYCFPALTFGFWISAFRFQFSDSRRPTKNFPGPSADLPLISVKGEKESRESGGGSREPLPPREFNYSSGAAPAEGVNEIALPTAALPNQLVSSKSPQLPKALEDSCG